MNLRFSPRSIQDLDRIFDYLNERGPLGAEKVLGAIHASIDVLKDYPYSAAETGTSGVRVQIVRRYKFQIFYRVEGDAIGVIHIRHTARKPFRLDT